MPKIAIFKIITSFNITDRGIVAFRHFIEGLAKIGSKSNVDINGTNTPVKIIGIEMGNTGPNDKLSYGLLLSFEDHEIEKVAMLESIKEQTIEHAFNKTHLEYRIIKPL